MQIYQTCQYTLITRIINKSYLNCDKIHVPLKCAVGKIDLKSTCHKYLYSIHCYSLCLPKNCLIVTHLPLPFCQKHICSTIARRHISITTATQCYVEPSADWAECSLYVCACACVYVCARLSVCTCVCVFHRW